MSTAVVKGSRRRGASETKGTNPLPRFGRAGGRHLPSPTTPRVTLKSLNVPLSFTAQEFLYLTSTVTSAYSQLGQKGASCHGCPKVTTLKKVTERNPGTLTGAGSSKKHPLQPLKWRSESRRNKAGENRVSLWEYSPQKKKKREGRQKLAEVRERVEAVPSSVAVGLCVG